MIAFISDIHGNYPALKAVINKIDALGCNTIISLGDVVGYYSMFNETINLLRKRNVINILGNHDDYLIHHVPNNISSKTVRLCIDYQRNKITDRNLTWLKESKEFIDNTLFSARHAGWKDIREERFDQFDFEYVKGYQQNLFISGHTHKQYIQHSINNKIYCNPGSVGQPRDLDPRAGFMILNRGEIQLYRIEYDIDSICNDMKHKGLGEWIYKGLYTGKGI